jgi:hypothetical protein
MFRVLIMEPSSGIYILSYTELQNGRTVAVNGNLRIRSIVYVHNDRSALAVLLHVYTEIIYIYIYMFYLIVTSFLALTSSGPANNI